MNAHGLVFGEAGTAVTDPASRIRDASTSKARVRAMLRTDKRTTKLGGLSV